MELLSRSYQSDHNLLKNSLMYGKRRVCQGKWLLHVKQTDCRCSEMMNQVMFKHTKNSLFAFLVMIKESWAHTSQSSLLLDLGLRDVDCTTWPFFAVEEEEFVLLPPPPQSDDFVCPTSAASDWFPYQMVLIQEWKAKVARPCIWCPNLQCAFSLQDAANCNDIFTIFCNEAFCHWPS